MLSTFKTASEINIFKYFLLAKVTKWKVVIHITLLQYCYVPQWVKYHRKFLSKHLHYKTAYMHLKHCFCNIVKLRIPLGTILPSLQVQVQGRLENRKKKEEKNSWVAQMALRTELLDYWKWRVYNCKNFEISFNWL